MERRLLHIDVVVAGREVCVPDDVADMPSGSTVLLASSPLPLIATVVGTVGKVVSLGEALVSALDTTTSSIAVSRVVTGAVPVAKTVAVRPIQPEITPDLMTTLLHGTVVVPGHCIPVGFMDSHIHIISVNGSNDCLAQPARVAHESKIVFQGPSDPPPSAFPTGIAQLDAIMSGATEFTGVIVETPDAVTLKAPVHTISVPSLFAAFRGEGERLLREHFDKICQARPRAVLLDQIEILSSPSNASERLSGALARNLDDLYVSGLPIVIVAPVTSSSLVPRLLRRSLRLDRVIQVRLPDADARRKALLDMGADSSHADFVSNLSCGMSFDDLRRLLRDACLNAIGRGAERANLDDWKSVLDRKQLKPVIRASELKGADDVLARLRLAVLTPLTNPSPYQRLGIRPPRGVLLYGPAGVGKTTLAMAIASEARATVFEARGCDLVSAVVGDSERAIRDLFARARRASPAIILIDQVEAIAPRRGAGGSRTHDRILSCLLTEMDGVSSVDPAPVVIIATTSIRGALDDALIRPGRLDHQIELGLPEETARLDILLSLTKSIPLAPDVDLASLSSTPTASFSPADLQGLCGEAALAALRRDMDSRCVSRCDFDSALRLLRLRSAKMPT
ncbi:AAA+ ATPase domain-containing protein [Plasmodiophora brassicae]|nr:hypothetical protein PBRA_005161 [Plasmodiophora brassicae]